MTHPVAPPPPGSPAPSAPQASWFAPPGYPVATPVPGGPGGGTDGLLAAIHKPGAFPLRPLGLGDIFDGAFRIIRVSPGATVGSAVLVTAVAMTIPILVTGILTSLLDLSLASVETTDAQTADLASNLTANGSLLGGVLLQGIGLIFVTGMIAQVTAAAAVGQKLTLAQAWAATAGLRLRLVGLSLVLLLGTVLYIALVVLVALLLSAGVGGDGGVVLAVLVGIAGTCGLVLGWGRVYYLAVPPLMVERIGIFAALGRAWTLTSRQFWRTIGIALLTMLVTQIIGGILTVPFTLLGELATTATGDGEAGLLVYVVTNAVALVMSSAFVAPFTSAVTTLQYVDQRMRKEGYDVELLTRTGSTS